MRDDNTHDYEDVGFNRFFRRSLGSADGAVSLRSLPANRRNINFDNQQVGGAMGDSFRAGTIVLDGKKGRISIFDETMTTEGVRLGDVDE